MLFNDSGKEKFLVPKDQRFFLSFRREKIFLNYWQKIRFPEFLFTMSTARFPEGTSR